MPALTPDQSTSLIERAADLLNDAAGLTSGSDPNYIRDAQPESLFEAIPLAAARQGCRRYADQGGNYPERRAARAERACRPYLDDLAYGSGPALDLDFRGGQCAILYNVSVNYTIELGFCGNTQTFSEVFANGIIGPVSVAKDNVGVTGGGANLCPGYSYGNIRLLNPQGQVAARGSGFGVRLNSLTVVPTSGGADNCGSPPPEYIPPTPPTNPGPRVEPFSPGPDIDIDIDVVVNIDGSIDIDIGTGPIKIDPFDEPGDPGGGGGGGGDPGDPTDPGSPGGPEGTGAGGDAEGMAPDGQELVGLLVTVSQAPGDANKFANNSKQPFRGIGYVRMGYPGRLGLDISGGTVISPQFFHAQQRGLTNWAVAANIGFDLTIQPYYRDIET